jgi:hypothetical protein
MTFPHPSVEQIRQPFAAIEARGAGCQSWT